MFEDSITQGSNLLKVTSVLGSNLYAELQMNDLEKDGKLGLVS
jgi:hypothetical protein